MICLMSPNFVVWDFWESLRDSSDKKTVDIQQQEGGTNRHGLHVVPFVMSKLHQHDVLVPSKFQWRSRLQNKQLWGFENGGFLVDFHAFAAKLWMQMITLVGFGDGSDNGFIRLSGWEVMMAPKGPSCWFSWLLIIIVIEIPTFFSKPKGLLIDLSNHIPVRTPKAGNSWKLKFLLYSVF